MAVLASDVKQDCKRFYDCYSSLMNRYGACKEMRLQRGPLLDDEFAVM